MESPPQLPKQFVYTVLPANSIFLGVVDQPFPCWSLQSACRLNETMGWLIETMAARLIRDQPTCFWEKQNRIERNGTVEQNQNRTGQWERTFVQHLVQVPDHFTANQKLKHITEGIIQSFIENWHEASAMMLVTHQCLSFCTAVLTLS